MLIDNGDGTMTFRSPDRNRLMKMWAQVKTCEYCKHYKEKYPTLLCCANDVVIQNFSEQADFWPPADFGCNQWEQK